MGLDMYFLDENDNQIFYFRKHADLHGFLSDIWYTSEGKNSAEEFNCNATLEITKDRLLALKKWLKSKPEKNLIHYRGFFWGESSKEHWRQTRKELIPLLEHKIKNNEKVYYTSWW